MDLGDRMKHYEKQESQRKFVMPNIPIIVRLDGRGFSKFTKKMQKPFDEKFTELMQDTAQYLVEQSNALIAYQQSDEITLVFCKKSFDNQLFFDAKIQKLVSVLAGLASSYFAVKASKIFPEECKKTIPMFDCRAFEVPSTTEACNCILWRMQDAVRNSKNMLGRHYMSHKEMMGKSADEVKQILLEEHNVKWEDLPTKFKEGSFIKRFDYYKNVEGSEPVLRHKVGVVIAPFTQYTTVQKIDLIFGEMFKE